MLTVGAFTEGAFTRPASSAASASVEVGRRLAEVAAGGGLGAVKPVAEIDLVQVQLENLVLLIHPLDAPARGQLPGPSAITFFTGKKTLPGELLGDGAAALCVPVPRANRPRRRPMIRIMSMPPCSSNRWSSNATMALREVRRHICDERDLNAIFLENRENGPVMDVVKGRRLRHVADQAQLVATREAGQHRPAPNDEDEGDSRLRHLQGGASVLSSASGALASRRWNSRSVLFIDRLDSISAICIATVRPHFTAVTPKASRVILSHRNDVSGESAVRQVLNQTFRGANLRSALLSLHHRHDAAPQRRFSGNRPSGRFSTGCSVVPTFRSALTLPDHHRNDAGACNGVFREIGRPVGSNRTFS